MKKVKLTSVCRPKQWKSIPISELSDVGYPVYGANGVIGYYDSYNHEQETVIITCRGATCGTVNLTHPRSYVTGNAMCLDNVKDSVDIKYLFYSMQAYDFTKVISGTAQPQITRVGLEKVEFALPSLDVQREIVSILDKIDTLIEKRRLQLKKLDDLIKARFVEMFGDPKLNDKGWNSGIISDYYEVKGGKRIPKGMGYADGITAHPYLRATDMKNETIVDDDIHYIDDDVFERIKRYTVKGGDIYLTNVGVNLGMAGVIPEKYDGANLTENAVKLVPKTEKVIDGVFLAYYINSPGIQDYINERKMSVGVPKLAIFRIETMPLLLPPIELQMKFIEFVNQIDKSKLLSGCRLFHSWAPENRDKPKHVGVPRRKTKDLRGGRRQQ